MTVTLNHTIIHAKDPEATAAFMTEMFGLSPPRRLGIFTIVDVGPTSLDYLPADGAISPRHFAFLVSEAEFDEILARVKARRLEYWADPAKRKPREINTFDDGRGVYFEDPNGHFLEAITRPYGGGGKSAKNPNPLLGD